MSGKISGFTMTTADGRKMTLRVRGDGAIVNNDRPSERINTNGKTIAQLARDARKSGAAVEVHSAKQMKSLDAERARRYRESPDYELGVGTGVGRQRGRVIRQRRGRSV